MTQQLATFDEILFTKGGFSDKKNAQKSFSFSAGARPWTRWRSYDAPPHLLVNWGEIPQGIPPPHSPFPSTYSASRCPVQFFKCDHLATIDRKRQFDTEILLICRKLLKNSQKNY